LNNLFLGDFFCLLIFYLSNTKYFSHQKLFEMKNELTLKTNRRRKLKLAFAELEREIEMIPKDDLGIYKGGDGSTGGPFFTFEWDSLMEDFYDGYSSLSSSSGGGYSFTGSISTTGDQTEVPLGFGLGTPDSNGISPLTYNGNTFSGSLGMEGSKLTLSISWSEWIAKFGLSVPDYQTKPDDLSIPSIPGTGSPYSFGVIFTF
jgi:hypothetical protein